jgi:exopolysaccharide biosynthesis protein
LSPFSCATPPSQTEAFLSGFSPEWTPLGEGVDTLSGSTAKPRLRFWAIRVDTANPAVSIALYPDGAPEDEAAGEARSVYVSNFLKQTDCVAGVNTSPFSPVSRVEGEPRQIIGVTVADGVAVSPPASRYDALVFYKDGRMAIENQGAIADTDAVLNAAGGFYALLKDGELTERARVSEPRHPRTAAGIAGAALYLLVIDGRQAASAGATEAETAFILRKLGAEDGLNFDGGGSTALAVRENGAVSLANVPAQRFAKGAERAVAACLGVKITPQTADESD